MNRHLLIFLDKTLFQCCFYLIALFAKPRKIAPVKLPLKRSECERVLVIRPGGIGDGLMSLPFLRVLRAAFPKGKISLICLKKNKLAYAHVNYFDELIVLDDFAGFLKSMRLFVKGAFDVVFDLEPFRKISSIISFISRAKIRVGFDTNDRRLLYTNLISYANEKVYESVNMMRQLEIFGIESTMAQAQDLSFSLPEGVVKEEKRKLEVNGIFPEKEFLFVVVPGVLKSHHRWNMSDFARCIDLVCEEDNQVKILLVGVSADELEATQVMAQVKEAWRIENLVGKTSYTESLAILSMSDILLACDGGIVYMAAAMGMGTLSLWGPGVMERFKPPGENHIGIRKPYPCVPCVNYSRLGEFPPCPYDRMCMNDITPDDVFSQYLILKSRIKSEELTRSLC